MRHDLGLRLGLSLELLKPEWVKDLKWFFLLCYIITRQWNTDGKQTRLQMVK